MRPKRIRHRVVTTAGAAATPPPSAAQSPDGTDLIIVLQSAQGRRGDVSQPPEVIDGTAAPWSRPQPIRSEVPSSSSCSACMENDLAGHPSDRVLGASRPAGHRRLRTASSRLGRQALHPPPGQRSWHAERRARRCSSRSSEIGSLMFPASTAAAGAAEAISIKRDWFRFYDQPPQPGPGHLVVQSWDIAMMTGGPTIIASARLVHDQGDYYLIDVFPRAAPIPDLRRKIAALLHACAETHPDRKCRAGLTSCKNLRSDLQMA